MAKNPKMTEASSFGRLGDSADGRRGRARRHFRIMPSGVDALARVREMRDGLWEGLNLSDVAAEAESSS